MNMPRMGGLDLIKTLRRQNPDVHIILITGYGTMETEKRAFSLGSNEYIPKPFDVQELRDRVDDYFKGRTDASH
jgi:two-component system chemotaxis response regulator CheY